jgi:hypothetical protein
MPMPLTDACAAVLPIAVTFSRILCCFAPNICSSLPWRLAFSGACCESANQAMTAGRLRLEPVKVQGQQKQSAAVITGRRFCFPVRRLLFRAKDLLLAAKSSELSLRPRP